MKLQNERTLTQYIAELQETIPNTELIEKFGIRDNFTIAFYGNGDNIWDILNQGFAQSPSSEALELYWQERYHVQRGQPSPYVGGEQPYDCRVYYCTDVGVIADLNRTADSFCKKELQGLLQANVCVVLHPTSFDLVAGDVTAWRGRLQKAIVDLGQFILKKELAAGFTGKYANVYYTP